MPAEWAPHDAVWMIWPYWLNNWRNNALPAQQTFTAVAQAIGQKMPVIMGVPAQQMAQARSLMPATVTLVAMGSDDAWMRDTRPKPTVVLNGNGERRDIDWQFNAWGGELDGLYDDWRRMNKSRSRCWRNTVMHAMRHR